MKQEQPNSNNLAALIANHRVFQGLAPQYIELLANTAMLKDFAPGEYLLNEGDPANRFYVILDGGVAIESGAGKRVRVQEIGADDVLGWSWLFPPYYWHFDARATKPTRAIFFYGTWLRENCERDHEFGYEMLVRFMPILVERLQAARKHLVRAENGSTATDAGA